MEYIYGHKNYFKFECQCESQIVSEFKHSAKKKVIDNNILIGHPVKDDVISISKVLEKKETFIFANKKGP